MEKTREEKIKELTALRAELLYLKEQQDGESGDNASNVAQLTNARKEYYEDQMNNNSSDELDNAKKELYAQYDDQDQSEERNDGPKLTLTRRR